MGANVMPLKFDPVSNVESSVFNGQAALVQSEILTLPRMSSPVNFFYYVERIDSDGEI
jgi:hypothetical protein